MLSKIYTGSIVREIGTRISCNYHQLFSVRLAGVFRERAGDVRYS